MALSLKLSYHQSGDCKSLFLKDITEIYDSSTNPTGWNNAVNPEKADVTVATATILKPDSNEATVDIFALGFPLTSEVEITSLLAGYGLDTKWTDGEYTITVATSGLNSNDSDTAFTTSNEICPFLYCVACCCINKKNVEASSTDSAQVKQDRRDARDLLATMIANIECGNINNAKLQLADLNKLCAGCCS